MLGDAVFRIVGGVTGALVAGEALALLVGMYVLSPRPNAWLTGLNAFWIGFDLVCGVGLVRLALVGGGGWAGALMLALVVLGAHVYRDWEYFAPAVSERFLANLPLFVMNNVKLLGLVAMSSLILRFSAG